MIETILSVINLIVNFKKLINHNRKKKIDPNYREKEITFDKFKTQSGQFISQTGSGKYVLVTNVDNDGRTSFINIKKQSLTAVSYAIRLLSIIMSLLFGFFVTIFWILPIFRGELSSVLNGRQTNMAIIILLLFLFFICSAIYFTRFVKTTSKEKFVREQFYKTTGYYIMPEWMFDETFNSFYQAMKIDYTNFSSSRNWSEMLKKLIPNENGFAISFCLTYMDNERENNKNANKTLVENYRKMNMK